MTIEIPVGVGDQVVLERASDLFCTAGYDNTTMRDIADAAGLRQLELFARYPSKEELLWRIAAWAHRQIIEGQHAAFRSASDTVGRLQAFVRFHSTFHARNNTVARLVNQNMSSLSAAHRAEAIRCRDTYDRRFRELLKQGVAEGCFDMTNVRVTAYAILEMGIEISVWFRPGGELSAEELASLHEELALRMVGYC